MCAHVEPRGTLQDRRGHGAPEGVFARPPASRVAPVPQEVQPKYRITSYGLTEVRFTLILQAQGNACGMCFDPFEEDQLIHVDHDHACCPEKNRSCGECIRGLSLRSLVNSAAARRRRASVPWAIYGAAVVLRGNP
jgi:hypothetical protein